MRVDAQSTIGCLPFLREAMTGHIRLSRDIVNWEWMDDSQTFHVFMFLLLNANFKDSSYHGYPIKRGDVIIGRKKIAEKLHLTERSVRTALNHLKSTNEVTIKTTNKFSVVTICNFESWQDYPLLNDQQNDQQSVTQATSNRPASDQQVTTSEEYKKERKIEEIKKEEYNNSPALSAQSELWRLKEEEMQATIDALKAELEEARKEKKKRAKPIPKTLGGFARQAFEEYYKEKKGIDYDWSAKDAASMKLLLQRIQRSRENRDVPLPCDDDNMIAALKTFFSYVKDQWLLEHLDVANLNSKYNDVVASAKEQGGRNKGNSMEVGRIITQYDENKFKQKNFFE